MAAAVTQSPSGEIIITPDPAVASDNVRIGGPLGVPRSRGSRHRVIVDLNGATGYTVKCRLYPAAIPTADVSFTLAQALTTILYPRNSTTATAADASLSDMVEYDVITDGDDLIVNIATSSPSGTPKIYVRPVV